MKKFRTEDVMAQIERMTVALPVEMASIIREAVESGDYASSSEVFRDAIRDWKRFYAHLDSRKQQWKVYQSAPNPTTLLDV